MEVLWILVALLIGGFAVYLLDKPRLKRAESHVESEKVRASEADKLRQNLEIENATLRAHAEKLPVLTQRADDDQVKILALTETASSAAASIAARDEKISELMAEHLKDDEKIASLRTQLTAIEVESASQLATIREREASLTEERSQFESIKEALKAQFSELSQQALAGNSEAFLQSAKRVLENQQLEGKSDLDARRDEIKTLIGPIEEGIKAIDAATREMETKRATAFGSIEEQLQQSVAAAAEVARQAGALRDALKRPTVRGRWGEVQLKICIELAGMEDHCDVEFQETSLSPDEEALRPDMIVRMPGGRKITVDSKTPMDHFLTYIEAPSEEARQSALISHGKAVKKHIGDLAKTDYMQRIAESPDFVVMFLPNESFLAMALEKEPRIMEDALNKKVLIATPGTLIGLLKVVLFGWNEEKLARNAQLISEEGSKLNGEIVKFLADFARLSLAVDSLNDAFGSSKRRAENQIAKSSLRLSSLGAKSKSSPRMTKKVLGRVTSMLKAAGADDEEIEQIEDPEQLAITVSIDDDEEE